MTIHIVKWANARLHFEQVLEEKDAKSFSISHHPSWFGRRRSIIRNLFYLAKQLIPHLIKSSDIKILAFGNNLCRVLFFKKNVILVYNEMPVLDEDSLLAGLVCKLDKFIFVRNFDRILVSSEERKRYLEEFYGVRLLGFLPNVPVLMAEAKSGLNNSWSNRYQDKIFYAGAISSNRLSSEVLNKVISLSKQLVACGPLNDRNFDVRMINYLGELSQQQAQEMQQKYKYALLAYPVSDANNDYCAPIKMYEYIFNNCVCVVANNNAGLKSFIDQYPNIFVSLTEINVEKVSAVDYEVEKVRFLEDQTYLVESQVQNIIDWRAS